MSAFAYSVETISVQLKKRKGKRTADSDQVIVSVKDEGSGIEPS
jgi:signal transduction histidine kinase